jgi:type VI protein secretion system component Hcp
MMHRELEVCEKKTRDKREKEVVIRHRKSFREKNKRKKPFLGSPLVNNKAIPDVSIKLRREDKKNANEEKRQ